MHTLPSFSRTKIRARIAVMLIAPMISLTALVPMASADPLTSAAAQTVGKGVLGSIFKKRTTVIDGTTTAGASGMDRVNRSILALPLGILSGLGRGASKIAGKTLTDHITHY